VYGTLYYVNFLHRYHLLVAKLMVRLRDF